MTLLNIWWPVRNAVTEIPGRLLLLRPRGYTALLAAPGVETGDPAGGKATLLPFAAAQTIISIRPPSSWCRSALPGGMGCAMKRTEAEFCREQAELLLKLAKECTDFKLRKHLTDMAQEWVERAKVKSTKEPA